MTSQERVLASLNHKEPDRVPFDIGGSDNSGININTYKRVREELGLSNDDVEIEDVITQRADVQPDFQEKLEIDVKKVTPGTPTGFSYEYDEDDRYYYTEDPLGIKWKMPKENGFYFDMIEHPLANASSVKDIENFEFPDPKDPSYFKNMEADIKKIDKRGMGFTISPPISGIFEESLWLRGFSEFYMDLAANPKMAEALLNKITEFKMQYWEEVFKIVGNRPVIIQEHDDIAGQDGPLISPQMLKEFVDPMHKKLFSYIRKIAQNDVHILYHSCGAVKELIPMLIEEGISALNPVQISAKGMDLEELKKEFGQDITFWGGGVDTQEILPNGTPEDVEEATKRSIDVLAPGGGFVFASVHNIQADVPTENFMAMWKALKEYGVYQ